MLCWVMLYSLCQVVMCGHYEHIKGKEVDKVYGKEVYAQRVYGERLHDKTVYCKEAYNLRLSCALLHYLFQPNMSFLNIDILLFFSTGDNSVSFCSSVRLMVFWHVALAV